MAISKYSLYKYVKVDSTWRYCKAAYHENSKIKPDVVFVNAKEWLLEKHPEGRYYMNHNGQWLDAGTDALEAQRKRKQRLALDEFNRLSGKRSAKSAVVLPDNQGRITLAAADNVILPVLSGKTTELCAEAFSLSRLNSSSANRCLRFRCATSASVPASSHWPLWLM